MKMRMFVILAALAMTTGCSKGGESTSEGKPAENKTVQEAPPQRNANLKAAQPQPQANVVADKGVVVEKVDGPPKAVLDAMKKRAPTAPKAPAKPAKVDPKIAAAAAAVKLPSKGSTNPKVEIIEVSDFQCPFCNRVNPTIKQLLDKFGCSRYLFAGECMDILGRRLLLITGQ